jgi:hypothetical protein
MADKLDFEDWWNDFTYQFRNDKDGGHEQIKRLISEVRSFPVDKREAFINELVGFDKLSVFSCSLICEFGTNEQLQLIKDKAIELIDNNSSDSILSEYINTIIARYEPNDNSLLGKYFLDYQNRNQNHIRIPGDLYNIEKELFLKAFAINIERYPIDKLCDYDGMLYLTQHLEALEYLIKELPFRLSEKLKLFALSKVNHSVSDLDKTLKSRLIDLVDLKKSEIENLKQTRLKTIKKREPPIE